MLITGVHDSLNCGSMAMVLGTVETIRRFIPDTSFTVLSSSPKIDCKRYERYNINVIRQMWYREEPTRLMTIINSSMYALFFLLVCFFRRISSRLSASGLEQYDVFIDLGGDTLSDYYGHTSLFYYLYPLLLGIILGKPVIIYAESIGPFQNALGRLFARCVINRVKLITVREGLSRNYLRSLGVNKPNIYLTADSAFVAPISFKRIDEMVSEEDLSRHDKLYMGIAASQGIHLHAFADSTDLEEKYRKYIQLMARVTDYLIEKTGATIIFIPHVIRPGDDDRYVSQKIYQEVITKRNVKLLLGEYRSDELKGIISKCEMFIGCRMHSTIASTSMLVPTVAISYSHKFHGIIGGMLGQEKLIIDVRDVGFEELFLKLKSTIDYAWVNRVLIREDLRQKMKTVQYYAFLNGKLVKKLLNSTQRPNFSNGVRDKFCYQRDSIEVEKR